MLGETTKKHAWVEYFRNLEDNEILFKRADEIIDQQVMRCYMDHQRIFAAQMAEKHLDVLSAFKTTGQLPMVVRGGA
jgi:hypothetical protein